MNKRKTIRLQNYDYTQDGAYFITICSKDKKPLFGAIEGHCVVYNRVGEIACEEIVQTNILRQEQNIQITKFIVMPNHVHMIVEIVGSRRAVTANERFAAPVKQSVSTIVRAYKAAVTRRIRMLDVQLSNMQVWQPRFYDHVIRNEQDYLKIWQYIDSNPLKWAEDCYFEDGHGTP